MRKLQVVIIFTLFLIAMSAVTLLAQGNPTRTRGAKAAYGYPTERYSPKKAKKSKKKKKHRQPAKKNKNAAPQYRKKNPWVN
ncbi:MAG TPA: hypothetical protein VK666_18175 [Chryseolinea sp.]|nr:hypothetical protein [Chryseolinea sp.]